MIMCHAGVKHLR